MSGAITTSSHRAGHLRILASAGSGKTYQLANRYLRLVHWGAEPDTILATTFTRLAAGEIRDRIHERLVEAVDDPAKRAALADHLGEETLSRATVLGLLTRLAQRGHEMNVRTIDSFFASIVAAFPLELGVPPGCRIVDEDEGGALRTEAIRRMLDEQDPQPLVETLRQLTRGDPERSVMRAIDRVVHDLYDISLETDDSAWDVLPTMKECDPATVPGLVEDLCALDVSPDKQWMKAHATSREQALRRDWLNFLKGGLGKAIHEGKETFYRKPIDPTILAAYEPLVRHAFAALVNRYRRSNLAACFLLGEYRRHYDALKRERRVMTFRDLTRALDRADSVGTLEEICFRIDRRLEHVLLDEFQDTSIAQWRALSPNLRELVSDETTGRSFFCVGDLKQSIYEWRDASPEILINLPELLFGEGADETHLRSDTLRVSYRSAQPVIDAVNCLCESLDTNPALAKFPEVAQPWRESFERHEVAPKNTDLPGFVQLRTVGPKEEASDESAPVEEAVECALALHRRAPGLQIGILTRTNKVERAILTRLQQQGVPVSGRGGGPLTDVPAVNAILDLLHLATAPEDKAAAFHIARTPLGTVVGFDQFDHAGRRRELARRVRREVFEFGFGRFMARLVHELAESCGPRELRRLVKLVEVAEAVDLTGSRDLEGFIRVIETRQVGDALPTPVQVMTIHKAKGLEFDAVILPDLGTSLAGTGTEKFVFEREGIVGPNTRITRHIPSNIRELLAAEGCDLEPLFEAQKQRRVRESLSILYVAMTRARQGLYMIIRPPKLNNDGSVSQTSLVTPAGVLWSAMGGENPPGPEEAVAEFGDANWMDHLPASATEPTADESPPPRAIRLRSGGRARFAARSTAPSEAAGGVDMRSRLSIPDPEATGRGTAIHALLEQIEWMEEFDPEGPELETICRQAAPRRDDTWVRARLSEFRLALESDDLCQLLARGGRDPASVRVWRERPFVRLARDGLQRGAIDRLEIEYEDGRPVRARVIDYKTDAIAAGELDGRVSHYRPQLEAYRAAVIEMFALAEDDVEIILAFVKAGLIWRGGDSSPSP